MLFNSLHFLIFLPLVVALYYLLAPRHRWILLFFASCYFYMVFVPSYILILFFLILIDFFSAHAIHRSQGRKRKLFLVLSLLSNILLLGFFKYFNFFNETLASLAHFAGSDFQPYNLNILLPVGLSFHTFQSMSYTIEVYKGRQEPEKHLGYFANYVLFFPQMVAGPIERYSSLGNELHQAHNFTYENLTRGLRLVLFGLFVKMAIADNLAPIVNQVYDDPAAYSSLQVFGALVCFSFQIYADFYGYSTIAVGSARLLGIRIMDNFRTPYLSKNISEFWSRWHISLSTWFRDYLYITLGGNRVKLPRWCFNIMVVFMVSGLWHGASWTFVVWGALHGILTLVERFFQKGTGFKEKEGWSLLNIVLTVKTFLLVTLIWVFFRAENFEKAELIFRSLLTNNDVEGPAIAWGIAVPFIALLVLSDILLYNSRFDERLSAWRLPLRWAVYSVVLFCLLALAGTQKFTFIYFQF
jgi:alginate O-acetyltransferase complex protein AlgI